MHTRTPRLVLWGARRDDIQVGGSADRVIQISAQLDAAIAAGYASVRNLGEMLNPLDRADPGRW